MKLADIMAKRRLAKEQAQEQEASLPPSSEEAIAIANPILEAKAIESISAIATVSKRPPRSFAEIMATKKAEREALALGVDSPRLLNSSWQDHSVLAKATEAEQKEGTVDATIASKQESFALDIILNTEQLLAKDMALAGKCFCLIGAAGTGKTTTQRAVAEQLLSDSRLSTTSFKISGGGGARVDAPSIAFVAYTRRAAANLERAVHKLPELEKALRHNIMTIHALLEYQPVFYFDEERQKETMRFEPQRHSLNPLNITHLVIEESSMVGLDLWDKLYDALPTGVQIIFIGDINQLPPVFGPSILNYALIQLPVVELKKGYRQAEDGSILDNAHKILAGKMVEAADDFLIVEGTKNHGQFKMAMALAKTFETWHNEGFYDPEQDMILSPFNKQDLGTISLNNWIAQFIGSERGAVVHEVIAGFSKLYLAIGDRVMFNKQDAIVQKITLNGDYMGKAPLPCSTNLTRFGTYKAGEHEEEEDTLGLGYENFSLEALEAQDMERKQAASHTVELLLLDSNQAIEVRNAGEFAPAVFSLGYVLTVHKAQGCEWRKVFFIQHKDHNIMNYRELVYTAITRARQQLIWVAKRQYIQQGIDKPRIKGNTIQDKIEYFNANMDLGNGILCTKPA